MYTHLHCMLSIADFIHYFLLILNCVFGPDSFASLIIPDNSAML